MAQSEGKIGSLFYGMSLDTKDFSKKIKDVRKKMKSFGKQMSDDFKAIAKGGTILASSLAAGSAGMLFFAKNTLEATNAQLLLADSIGATQAEIAGLELMIEKWGVETNMVIDKMREFGGLDEFKSLAEDVKNAGDEQAQLNKAVEIFGGEGAKMLPLLQQGAAVFADMEQEAHKLGLALSPEQIAESRVAWEEYESTILSIKGLLKQIGTAFLEPLGLISAGVRGFIETFRGGIVGGFQSVADTITSFIRGSFNLFIEYGIPFINGFISFAGQIGDAFEVLFDWLSPATTAVGKGFGSLFKGITEFLATFKQNVVLYISAPIEAVINGLAKILIGLNKTIQEFLTPIAFGLAEIGAVTDDFAYGLSGAFDDQQRKMQFLAKDLSKPFKDAQDNAVNEMADILFEQSQINKREQNSMRSYLDSFTNKFTFAIEKIPVIALDAAKKMSESVSDKMSGMVLSGSQEEARIINQSGNKMLELAQDQLKTEKETLRVLKNLDII